MTARATQTLTVLGLLRAYGTVSAHDLVFAHGITRVAARVWDLKQAGHVIVTIPGHTLPDGTKEMARYRLIETPPQPRTVAVFGQPETGR